MLLLLSYRGSVGAEEGELGNIHIGEERTGTKKNDL